jgi:hypothetical protein
MLTCLLNLFPGKFPYRLMNNLINGIQLLYVVAIVYSRELFLTDK